MSESQNQQYDLLVIGGGVNGTGIAADAAGRGLKVLLCEQNDLASATSSNSSKLIHGGLRYLEHYEFRLVKEALAEREVLLANAPHIMWPLRFILPHRPHLRPAWMIRAGLFLYDNLAKRSTLGRSKGLRFNSDFPLQNKMKKGFEYSDGWVDDARLVVLNALAAKQHGSDVYTNTKCTNVKRENGLWHAELVPKDEQSAKPIKVTAKAVVNAAGPWVSSIFDDTLKMKAPQQVRLVKGSHIIVPKVHDLEQAFILQNDDNRIVFVLPYENDFSLIGTTDVEYTGEPSKVAIDNDEVDYLIRITNEHFKQQISKSDVVHTYSGVRPLLEDESSDPQAVTRDYTLEIQSENGHTPILSVFGGKITTYRKLAEAVVNQLNEFFPEMKPAWTKQARLPGGDFESKSQLFDDLSMLFPFLPEGLITRYVRTYGSLSYKLLSGVKSKADMGRHFGAELYEAEIIYLVEHEWASMVEDVLWRRTKLGLRFSSQQTQQVEQYLSQYRAQQTTEQMKQAC